MNKRYLVIAALFSFLLVVGGCELLSSEPADASAVGGGGSVQRAMTGPGEGYPSGLVVVGTGTAESDPDVAYINLGVDLQGEDAATIVSDATDRMNQVLDAIKGAGVADQDIRTVGYNLWVEQQHDPQTGRPTGEITYRVSHTVRVTVRDLDQVGALLSQAVDAGANSVGGVSFSVEDPAALNDEARQQAIADAQEKARKMAGDLDVTLGKIISVSEGGGAVPVPTYAEGRGGASPVPIQAGSFSVTVNVVLVYELP